MHLIKITYTTITKQGEPQLGPYIMEHTVCLRTFKCTLLASMWHYPLYYLACHSIVCMYPAVICSITANVEVIEVYITWNTIDCCLPTKIWLTLWMGDILFFIVLAVFLHKDASSIVADIALWRQLSNHLTSTMCPPLLEMYISFFELPFGIWLYRMGILYAVMLCFMMTK